MTLVGYRPRARFVGYIDRAIVVGYRDRAALLALSHLLTVQFSQFGVLRARASVCADFGLERLKGPPVTVRLEF
jgi:hypothetical protein